MPKDLDIEIADMMKLFYDLERKNGVVIRVINNANDKAQFEDPSCSVKTLREKPDDLSGYLI